MSEQRFNTSATPHITVESCGGDLSIEATAASEVTVEFNDKPGDARREGETLRVSAPNDCAIVCPPASTITLQHVGADLSVSDLEGTLAIQSIGGDLSVRGAGVATLQSVGGDASVRDVAGDLRIESVGGDLGVRRIGGSLRVNHAGGDFSARGIDGGVEVDDVGGDASLELDLSAGRTYRVRAQGDLTLRLPPNASARFDLKAGGEIEDRIGLSDWSGSAHAGQGSIGDGAAQVELSAGGDLALLPASKDFDFDFNFDVLGSHIEAKMELLERELEAKMSELGQHIEQLAARGVADLELRLRKVGAKMSDAGQRAADRASERTRQQTARITERMREKVERARRQAERAEERARRHARHQAKSHGFSFNIDLTPPGPPSKPGRQASPTSPGPQPSRSAATEEERLAILRMLAEHKISADDASRLLEALEG